MLSADPPFQLHCPCLDHAWDYNTHHVHPVDFENLPESHFTELQSVQPLHASNVHRFPEVESSHFIDPGLTGHHLTLPPPQVRLTWSRKHLLLKTRITFMSFTFILCVRTPSYVFWCLHTQSVWALVTLLVMKSRHFVEYSAGDIWEQINLSYISITLG